MFEPSMAVDILVGCLGLQDCVFSDKEKGCTSILMGASWVAVEVVEVLLDASWVALEAH